MALTVYFSCQAESKTDLFRRNDFYSLSILSNSNRCKKLVLSDLLAVFFGLPIWKAFIASHLVARTFSLNMTAILVVNNNLNRSMKESLTPNGLACVFVELKASELN